MRFTSHRTVLVAALAASVSAGLAADVSAGVVMSDGFPYTVGGQLSPNTNASTGTDWLEQRVTNTANPSGQPGSVIVAGDLTYPGLDSTDAGAMAQPRGAVGPNTYDRISLGSAFSSGSLYYSLLLNVSDLAGANFRQGSVGSFLAGFNNGTGGGTGSIDTNITARLRIRNVTPGIGDGGANSGVATAYVIGIQNSSFGVTAGGASNFQESKIFDTSHTVLVVVEYQFNPGTNDDLTNLYINPAASTFGPGGTGTVGLTPDASSTGDFFSSPNEIQSFVLRSNSTLPFGVNVDDVRVGTTFADVTPVPEPASLALVGMLGVGFLARRRRD